MEKSPPYNFRIVKLNHNPVFNIYLHPIYCFNDKNKYIGQCEVIPYMSSKNSMELNLGKFKIEGNRTHTLIDKAHVTENDPLAREQKVKVQVTYNNLNMQKFRMVGNLSLERFDIIKIDKL